MIGIDTNVLVRAFVFDDPEQSRLVTAFMASLRVDDPGFVSMVVMAEFAWVLDRSFGFDKQTVLDSVEMLLAAEELEFEDGETVWRALVAAREGADFADALIKDTADLFGSTEVVTFDQSAARTLGMRLLA